MSLPTIVIFSAKSYAISAPPRFDQVISGIFDAPAVNKSVTPAPVAGFVVLAMALAPLKDGIRSEVRIDFYGNVHKRLRGTDADKRYATEVAVLKVLEERGCPYAPRLLEEHPEELYFVSTNVGKIASQISKEKSDKLFAKLEKEYGIRHLDAEPRNITYNDKLGCFCIIDFELAEILPPPPDLVMPPPAREPED